MARKNHTDKAFARHLSLPSIEDIEAELSAKPASGATRKTGRGKKAWAYPVVANGRLYVRDLGVLWCYDVSEAGAKGR